MVAGCLFTSEKKERKKEKEKRKKFIVHHFP